jgi:hypothetical protein
MQSEELVQNRKFGACVPARVSHTLAGVREPQCFKGRDTEDYMLARW